MIAISIDPTKKRIAIMKIDNNKLLNDSKQNVKLHKISLLSMNYKKQLKYVKSLEKKLDKSERLRIAMEKNHVRLQRQYCYQIKQLKDKLNNYNNINLQDDQGYRELLEQYYLLPALRTS